MSPGHHATMQHQFIVRCVALTQDVLFVRFYEGPGASMEKRWAAGAVLEGVRLLLTLNVQSINELSRQGLTLRFGQLLVATVKRSIRLLCSALPVPFSCIPSNCAGTSLLVLLASSG